MEVRFLETAKWELVDAINYYEEQKDGLGGEFEEEVKKTVERILEYPQAWAPLSTRTRRCRTNRFPYGIIYQIREDFILIVAVMNLFRNPTSWQGRLGPFET